MSRRKFTLDFKVKVVLEAFETSISAVFIFLHTS